MPWQHTVYVYPILFATAVAAVLAGYTLLYVREHGPSPVFTLFLALTVGLALWSGFSALKLLQTDPAAKLLLYRFLYFGVAPLGPLSLLFALALTDREEWLRRPVVAGLFVPPVVYLVLLFTNPGGVAFEGTRLVRAGGVVVLRVDVGVAHILTQGVYNVLLSLLTLGLVGYEAVRLGRSYVPQAALLGVGIAAPLLFTLAEITGVPPFDPDGVNLIPTSGAVTAAALGLAVFRYRWLDLPPVAYTTAVAESPDGVLVLGPERRIVHANARGRALLTDLSAGVGDPFEAAFPDVDPTSAAGERVRVGTGDDPQFLGVRSQPVERHARTLGWVVVLRDVTELERSRRRIERQNERLRTLNRIVRHDIRNDMSVVLGNARLLEETVEGEAREQLDTIVSRGEHVVELTDAVRTLMRATLDDQDGRGPVALGPVLRRELEDLASADDRVIVDPPQPFPSTTVLADDMLGTVFRNLLTNAVQHNDSDVPEVSVSVVEDEEVVVRIADNGPGLPDDRKESVFGRGEKGSGSTGTGLGLHLVDTLVESYGGSVRVEDNEPRGSVFVVRLPTAPDD